VHFVGLFFVFIIENARSKKQNRFASSISLELSIWKIYKIELKSRTRL